VGGLIGTGLEEEWEGLLRHLSNALHERSRVLILVEPPLRGKSSFTSSVFKRFSEFVDHFVLMTYDYSSRKPGPNAPLPWLEETLKSLLQDVPTTSQESKKLLLGLPFYGYDFEHGLGARAILGREFVDMLQGQKPSLSWDEKSHEHYFEYTTAVGSRHVVYYPSLQFIEDRLQLARDLGVGVAIWEIGQGLEYFFDLL